MPFVERKCKYCHASADPGKRKDVGATEALLCRRCHHDPEFKPGISGSHVPIRKGRCRVCHDPHGSEEDMLLVKAQP
ncbi:MAG: cytochrome c3 family protein, partial [Planctomycetota bacterium]